MTRMLRNLLFTMSFSGLVTSIFWLIVCKIYFLEFKAKWLRNMVLLAIPFYFLPLPLFKHLWLKLFLTTGIMPASLPRSVEGIVDKAYMIVRQQKMLVFTFQEKLLIVFLSIMAVASILFLRHQARTYIHMRQAIKHNARLPLSKSELGLFYKTKRQMGVRQKVELIKSSKTSVPFTVGIRHPVVVVPECLSTNTQAFRMVLGHELSHIKHKDAFLNLFSCVIISIHWFNPICYMYLGALREANELYCDETTIETLPDVDSYAYCQLLIQLSSNKGLPENLFTINFIGNAKKQIQRRIDNIMKGKKRKFGMAVILGSLMFCAGLGSTFAYAGTNKMYINSEEQKFYSDDEMSFETTNFDGENLFNDSSDGASSEDTAIPCDEFFVDEEGNIFPCEDAQTRAICIHSYVDGTLKVHHKMGTGCKIEYYHAKRCTICKTIVSNDLYKTITWVTCPH